MNKRIVLTALVAVVAGLGGMTLTARAQGNAAPAAAANVPHKVGLIDMAHIFKNYKKFQALRDELKAEIDQTEGKAKQMLAQVNAINGEMKEMKQGSPNFVAKEKQLLTLNSELESFRRNAQRDFLKKESQIYKTIYLEVSDAVEKYAYYYKYTLIMRFNREELDGADEPQDVLARMNKQVVYYRAEDDITVSVLDFLNKKYGPTDEKPAPTTDNKAKPPARTASGK